MGSGRGDTGNGKRWERRVHEEEGVGWIGARRIGGGVVTLRISGMRKRTRRMGRGDSENRREGTKRMREMGEGWHGD